MVKNSTFNNIEFKFAKDQKYLDTLILEFK